MEKHESRRTCLVSFADRAFDGGQLIRNYSSGISRGDLRGRTGRSDTLVSVSLWYVSCPTGPVSTLASSSWPVQIVLRSTRVNVDDLGIANYENKKKR